MHFNCGIRLILFFAILPLCLFSEVGYFLPWGKDADLAAIDFSNKQESAKEKGFGQITADIMIEFHQSVISPADGPRSHFRPSSSTYTKNAIDRYGLIKGFLLGCDRLMRENNDPWLYPKITTEEGTYKYDPVP